MNSANYRDVQTLFKKIADERDFWGITMTLNFFTGSLNISQRNKLIHNFLSKDIELKMRTWNETAE